MAHLRVCVHLTTALVVTCYLFSSSYGFLDEKELDDLLNLDLYNSAPAHHYHSPSNGNQQSRLGRTNVHKSPSPHYHQNLKHPHRPKSRRPATTPARTRNIHRYIHTTPAPTRTTRRYIHTTPAPTRTTRRYIHTTPAPTRTTRRYIHTTPAPTQTTRRYIHTTPAPSLRRPTTRKQSSLYSSHSGRTDSCGLSVTPTRCDSSEPYRSFDGSCNNLHSPSWGQSNRPHKRLLAPQNENNGGIRVTSKTGGTLPSTRKVSTLLYTIADNRDLSKKFTTFIWLWGQFIDHDLTFTPQVTMRDCCNGGSSRDCIPIDIPVDDPFWSRKRKTCMNLVRSKAVEGSRCGVQYREQINELTSYLDASVVYGSTQKKVRELRSYRDGKMKTGPGNTLPTDKPGTDCMLPPRGHPDRRCFAAGDSRSSEWVGLTSLHTIFLREHNRIADRLSKVLRARQPSINAKELDEKVFQETRRIISAYIQVITYRDYLPLILGHHVMRSQRLTLGSPTYDPKADATLANVFATAAFRFGHSQLTSGTQPMTRDYKNATAFVNLVDTFNQPMTYKRVGQDNLIRGMCVEPAQSSMDDKFTTEIRDRLFEKTFNGNGLDLPAVNAQRGRDHGIPSYNNWRRHCGLPVINSFKYMPSHRPGMWAKFAEAYPHPDDIDLFPGAVTENAVSSDALVGPTFACLIGDQFNRIKHGDRFWFENQGTYKNSFTRRQIDALKKVTLSKIICDNSDPGDKVPHDVFTLHSRHVACDQLYALDLDNWI